LRPGPYALPDYVRGQRHRRPGPGPIPRGIRMNSRLPMPAADSLFAPRLAQRRLLGRFFAALCLIAGLLAVVMLFVLLAQVWSKGADLLSWQFLTRFASMLDPLTGGIKAALWGTVWLISLTAAVAIPVGVSAAIYLEEYAPSNRLTRFIQLNIANLPGVPSLVYGLLHLTGFVLS